DNMRSGMDATEARRQALMKLGGVTQARELYRDRNRLPVIENFFQDVRYGMRVLLKTPGYTPLPVLTLPLAIGPTPAIFTIVNTVMLRPLPYANPDRLVLLNETAKGRGRLENMSVSWPTYLDWKRQAQSFQYLGVFRYQNLTLTGGVHAERLNGAMASADVF